MSESTLHDLLLQRRTTHDFVPQPPAWSEIEPALQAACFAPNHYFTQPWRFYRIGEQTKAQIVELNAGLVEAKSGPQAAAKKRSRWASVPGWLVITCQRNSNSLRAREDYAACCCAVQNLMLDLWSRGIGSKWTTGDVTRQAEFYRLLGIKAHQEEVVALLWYGRPAAIPKGVRSNFKTRLVQLP